MLAMDPRFRLLALLTLLVCVRTPIPVGAQAPGPQPLTTAEPHVSPWWSVSTFHENAGGVTSTVTRTSLNGLRGKQFNF